MLPSLEAVARGQRGAFTRRQALDAGYSAAEIRARVDRGQWVILRRGVMAAAERLTSAVSDRDRHLVRCGAALLSQPRAVLSHRSAALAWDLPVLGAVPDRVALTLEDQHRRRSAGLELHVAVTPPHHRRVVDGLAVTSVARTVSDVARSMSFGAAVVTADAALHQGRCSSADIAEVIRDCPVWPGIARTKRVAEFADRRSESPGESLSRVAIAAAGFPVPDLQVELLLGTRRARVDFMWPELRVVGEFDGRVKYGRGEDVWQEKLREDAIRRYGHRVVRWTWADVYPSPEPMVRLLASALT